MNNKLNILIAKYLSGNTSPNEQVLLENWINESKSNEARFNEYKKIWTRSFNLKVTKQTDANEAWEEFKQLAAAKPKHGSGNLYLKAAAILVCVFLAALVMQLFNSKPAQQTLAITTKHQEPKKAVASPQPVINTANEKKRLVQVQKTAVTPLQIITKDTGMVFLLPDSSTVYLNKNSSLTLSPSFGKKDRRLKLNGEAFFEVRHLETAFIVSCNNTAVHDIGTSFNLRGNNTDTTVDVSVVSGKVEFYPENKPQVTPLMLKAGNGGIYHSKSNVITKTKNKRGLKWWTSKSLKNRIREFFHRIKSKHN